MYLDLKEREKEQQKLEDALVEYIRKVNKSTRGEKDVLSYTGFLNDKLLLIRSIGHGVPYDIFSYISHLTPFSEEEWADYLNVSVKTLQRHRKEKNFVFKPIHSEKILELAEATKTGEEIFGTIDKFYYWLYTPILAFGNMKPVELLKNSFGREMVMDEMNRIEHGIFA